MAQYAFHCTLLAFLIGVGLGTVWQFATPITLWIGIIGFSITITALKFWSATYAKEVLLSGFFIVAIALGFGRISLEQQSVGTSPLEAKVGEMISFVGVVTREPEKRQNTTRLFVKSSHDLILVTTDPLQPVSYGDKVQIEGILEKPRSFTTDLGREFDYGAYLLAKGVEYQVPFAAVEVIEREQGIALVAFLFAIKQTLMQGIEATIPEPQAGLAEGLLLGVKQALGDDIEEVFRKTGIIHIVVLSGYNIMLVVAFVLYIFSFFLRPRWRFVAGLIAIIGFALIVGLSATVVRASIMASLLLFAQTFGRTYDIMRSLLFAGAIMVFINPYLLLYDIGFQLSFMATLGLIFIAPRFETFITEGITRFGVREYLTATIATQVAVLPLLIYHIGEVSLIAVVVNVLVLPAVPLAMLASFLSGVVGIVSTTLAIPFAFIAYLSLSYILSIATLFAEIPFASVALPILPVYSVFILYGCFVVILWWFSYRAYTKRVIARGWSIEEEIEKARYTVQ